MRAVIQKVRQAKVAIDEKIFSKINKGLLVFVGIEDADSMDDIVCLSTKIVNMRIFDDENGVMNLSAKETNAEILLVSQFTLHASTKKGNRPSYIKAAKAEIAIPLYEKLILQLQKDLQKNIGTGKFGADMQISLINDGPVTICLDTKNRE